MDYYSEQFCDLCQLYSPTVIYDGAQYFWKNKSSIYLTIVEHCSSYFPGVVEVIAYDPLLREEAPRLYLHLDEIEKQVDRRRLSVHIQIAVDRRGCSTDIVDFSQLRKQVFKTLKVDYLLTRISINSKNHNNLDKLRNLVEDRRADNEWSISLIAHFNDPKDEDGNLLVLCQKPLLLTPYEVTRKPPRETRWQLIKLLLIQFARNETTKKKESPKNVAPLNNVVPEGIATLSPEGSRDNHTHHIPRAGMLHSSFDGQLPVCFLGQGHRSDREELHFSESQPCDLNITPDTHRHLSIHDVISSARRNSLDVDHSHDSHDRPPRRPSIESFPHQLHEHSIEHHQGHSPDPSHDQPPHEHHVVNRLLPLVRTPSRLTSEPAHEMRHIFLDLQESPRTPQDVPRKVTFDGSSPSPSNSNPISPTEVNLECHGKPRKHSMVGVLAKGPASRRASCDSPCAASTVSSGSSGSDEHPNHLPVLAREASRRLQAVEGPALVVEGHHASSPSSNLLSEEMLKLGLHLPPPIHTMNEEDTSRVSNSTTPTVDSSSEYGNGMTPKPRTFAHFNATYYYNKNTQHEKSYHSHLQRMSSRAAGSFTPKDGNQPSIVGEGEEDSGAIDPVHRHFSSNGADIELEPIDDNGLGDRSRKLFDTSALHSLHAEFPSGGDAGLSPASALQDDIITSDNVHRLQDYVKALVRQASSLDSPLSL